MLRQLRTTTGYGMARYELVRMVSSEGMWVVVERIHGGGMETVVSSRLSLVNDAPPADGGVMGLDINDGR